MNIKLTLYLTAVLALAIVAVVFVVNPRQKSIEHKEAGAKMVFHVRAADITGMTIRNKNGSFVLHKGTDGGWRIASPVTTSADTAVVAPIASSLAALKYEKMIGALDPAAFGLIPARITATVTTASRATYTLRIGTPAPIGYYRYAEATNGTPGIFTVSDALRQQLDDTLFQLRDKGMLRLDRSDIAAVAFTERARPVFTLARQKGTWVFTRPSYNRVKASVINDMMLRLANMEATDIMDGKQNMKRMGLEKPSKVISIRLMNNKLYTVAIGNDAGSNGVYATVSGRGPVYVTNAASVSAFTGPVADMIDHGLLSQNRYAVSSVKVTMGKKTALLTKKSYNVWDRNGAAFTDVTDVNNLLDALTSLRARRFVRSRGTLRHAPVTLTVVGTGSPTTTTISIGGRADGIVYARTSIDPRLAELKPADAAAVETSARNVLK